MFQLKEFQIQIMIGKLVKINSTHYRVDIDPKVSLNEVSLSVDIVRPDLVSD